MPVTEDDAIEDRSAQNECHSLQQEEYEVLESIYPECVSSQIMEGTLKLEVPIEFGESRTVIITEEVPPSPAREGPDSEEEERSSSEALSISTLPPLLVHLALPPGYPLREPPLLLSIRATHLWLPRLAPLNKLLTDMWQPGEGVLYNWIEYLRTGEFIEPLNLTSLVNGTTIIEIPHPSPRALVPLLSAFDMSSKSFHFTRNAYPCSICLTTLKGSKCLQLSCDHIFCRPCLQDFWGMCIEEGDVGRVGCPDPGCVKNKREAVEEEVARVVSEAEVARWRWLREKRNLEKDPTIIHCPIAVCQAPVSKTGEDDNSGWDRFRQCSRCSFSFCAFCRRTWHGPITACMIAHSEKVVLEYLAEDEGSPGRDALEKRYGRANVLRLIAAYEEEMANKAWISSSTMACPGCEIHVEKSLGCNHMTCWKCGQHFCYRCGVKLVASNPYAHFSEPGSCYQKLFDFQADDGEWQPMEGGLEA